MSKNIRNILSGQWLVHPSEFDKHQRIINQLVNGKIEFDANTPTPIISQIQNLDYVSSDVSAIGEIPHGSEKQYLAFLKVHGVLQSNDGQCGDVGMERMTFMVSQWKKDSNCIGLFCDIDTPGGEAHQAFKLSEALENFTKPKVAYINREMCSAGVLITSSFDQIIADKDADAIGSVGVIMTWYDRSKQLKKQGIEVKRVVAQGSPNKTAYQDEVEGGYTKMNIFSV